MKKHKLEKFLSSVFGSHMDHEHSEVLQGKEEMEKKIEKILNIVKKEKMDENSEADSELISLVENFYESYHTLYGKYDHLMGKLKTHVHHKKEINGDNHDKTSSSDSESSHSDSDEKSKKKKRKGGASPTQALVSIQEHEALREQFEKLKNKLKNVESETNVLCSKLKDGESLVTEKEATISALDYELQSMRERTKALDSEGESLKLELETCKKQHADDKKALNYLKEEKEALISEKSVLLANLHDAENSIEALRVQGELLKDETVKLQNEDAIIKKELEEAVRKNSELNKQMVTNAEEKDVLIQDLAAIKDENVAMNSDFTRLSMQMQQTEKAMEILTTDHESLKAEDSKLLVTIAGLNEQLKFKDDEIIAMSLQFSEKVDEIRVVQERIEILSIDLDQSKSEKSQLFIAYEGLKDELKSAEDKLSEVQSILQVVQEEKHGLSTEIDALISEKSLVLNRLHDAERVIEELKSEKDLFRDEVTRFQTENAGLKHDLEATANQVAVLNRQLTVLIEEKDGLLLEKTSALSKIEEAEKTIQEHMNEASMNIKLITEKSMENEKLLMEYEHLNCKLEEVDKQKTELSQELATAKEEAHEVVNKLSEVKSILQAVQEEKHGLTTEIDTLISEKSLVLNRLHDAENMIEELKSKKDMLKDEINRLESENAAFKQELEMTADQIAILGRQLTGLIVEKDGLLLEKTSVLSKIEVAEKAIEEHKNEASMNNNLLTEKLMENENLLLENEHLNRKLVELGKQKIDLSQELATAKEKANEMVEKLRGDYEALKDVELKLLNVNTHLTQQLRVKGDEINALSSKHTQDIDEIRMLQEQIEKLAKDLEMSNNQNSQLLIDYETLNVEFKNANDKVSELETMLQSMREEKHKISSESVELLSKVEQFEKLSGDLETETHRLKSENSELHDKIDDLSKTLKAAEEANILLAAEISALSARMQQFENGRCQLESEVERLTEGNQNFHKNMADLEFNISDLEKRLEGKVQEAVILQRELAEVQIRASSEMKVAEKHATDLQSELDLLQKQRSDFEEQIRVLSENNSERSIMMEKIESDLISKVHIQEKMLNDQKNKFDEIAATYKLLEDQYHEACLKLDDTDVKLKEMDAKNETILGLQAVHRELNQVIAKLESDHKKVLESLEQSEAEHTSLENEITRLQGQCETLEVQLRLSNQKLKITETENKEREAQIMILSGKTLHLESDLSKIKEMTNIGLTGLGSGLQNLEVAFDANCGLLNARLSNCAKEMQKVKERLKTLILKQQELEHKKHELQTQVKDKDGILSMLKEEAGGLEVKLAAKEREEERLKEMTVQYEKKLLELEERVKETEADGLHKDEEKREAIRQLCSLIEYYREKCDHLLKVLSAKDKGTRR